MADSIKQFLFGSLREMNIDTEDIGDETQLGPRGADLASLTLAELALRVEEKYGLKFREEETDTLAGMTVGEFCALVAERTGAASTGPR